MRRMTPVSNESIDITKPRLVLDGIGVVGSPDGATGLVSLSLVAGRCLTLYGSSEDHGALLLDVVAGHARQTNGRVLLNGRDLAHLPPEVRAIGLVSARDPLFPHLNVLGNLDFPLRARAVAADERNRRVRDTLALLGLDAVSRRRPATLCVGDLIRTAIARAMVSEPRVLLLDAPFASASPVERTALQRALWHLIRARGLTVLVTTVDRDEALQLGDEIGVLEAGRLHQIGTATTLLDRPVDPVVARRIGDANLLAGQVIRIDDEVGLIRLAGGSEMEAELGDVLDVGSPCVLCVRPDRIATTFPARSHQGAAADTVLATLLEATHFGDHLRLRFRLADGGEILVRRPPAASMVELRPDRTALLAWQAHQARVFAVPE